MKKTLWTFIKDFKYFQGKIKKIYKKKKNG